MHTHEERVRSSTDCIIIQTNELSFGKCSPLEKQSSVCDRDRPRNSINMFNQMRHGAPVMPGR